MNKFIICCFLSLPAFSMAQENIVYFDEPFALSVFGSFGIGAFSQGEEAAEYQAQNPWTLGFGLRYKQLSFALSLPSFYAFEDNPFKSFNVQINSYYNAVYYETFLKNYRGFSNSNDQNDDAYIDLNLLSAGISAGWIQNNKNHSLRAAYDLDGRQSASSGSFLLGAGVFYTSIDSGDDGIRRYADEQRFIHFGPNAGYSYTFVFSHSMFFNINRSIGLDAGININENRWLFIPQIMPKLSFGYHGKSWSVSFIGDCNYTIIFWDTGSFDNILLSSMTIAFSKRFSI
jgi:hypothetical protein